MNSLQFKAWFDGFTENMDKPPTERQWSRIKEQVKNIHIFYDYPYHGVRTSAGLGMFNQYQDHLVAQNAAYTARTGNYTEIGREDYTNG